jgi:signal transduction histidine kinase
LRNNLGTETVETDLNEIVRQVLESFRELPHGRMVRDLQPLPKVRVDPGQIRNVVINLLLNARDAISLRGTIAVQTRLRGRHAVLAVKDDGCGMTSEFIDSKLFRPFQTTKETGMGIGMFQSKAIIDAHGGRIEVESLPGKGTTFRITLPVSYASSEPLTKRSLVAEVLAGS